MKLSRRNFFRAAAASPIAIRQAATEAVAGGMGTLAGLAPQGGTPMSSGGLNTNPYDKTHAKLLEMVRGRKVPEWQMISFRQQARSRSRYLDADILNLKSISDASRYRLQYDRELARVQQDYIDNHDAQSGWSSLYQSFCDRVWPS